MLVFSIVGGDAYKNGASTFTFINSNNKRDFDKDLLTCFKYIFEPLGSQKSLTQTNFRDLALPCYNSSKNDPPVDTLRVLLFHTDYDNSETITLERKKFNNLDCIFVNKNYSYFCKLNEDSFLEVYSGYLNEKKNNQLEEILKTIKIRDVFILPRLRAV